jgi:hypothetical protein
MHCSQWLSEPPHAQPGTISEKNQEGTGNIDKVAAIPPLMLTANP